MIDEKSKERTLINARSTLNSGLSDRLKSVRKAIGVTQKEMDPLFGLGKRSWQRYESGKNAPGSKVIAELALKGFDANWILTGQGEMRRPSAAEYPQKPSSGYVLRDEGDPSSGIEAKNEAVFLRLKQTNHTLEEMEREAGWKPPVYWHELIKTLMFVHGLDEPGAARLLDALQSHLKTDVS
ncbi:hypothetical protein MNBD_GAMMA20-2017 [hydrothermal vent metagenome]|uniref:HTH cro/C1-type domain-containing protein n=1 Tax=hydrothermal vent metagenome TaxID=652676 RepID=A0A3B1AE35_9ZZZZ